MKKENFKSINKNDLKYIFNSMRNYRVLLGLGNIPVQTVDIHVGFETPEKSHYDIISDILKKDYSNLTFIDILQDVRVNNKISSRRIF